MASFETMPEEACNASTECNFTSEKNGTGESPPERSNTRRGMQFFIMYERSVIGFKSQIHTLQGLKSRKRIIELQVSHPVTV